MEVVNSPTLLRGEWEGDTASRGALDEVFTETDWTRSRVRELRLLLHWAPGLPGSCRLQTSGVSPYIPYPNPNPLGKGHLPRKERELSRPNGFKMIGVVQWQGVRGGVSWDGGGH